MTFYRVDQPTRSVKCALTDVAKKLRLYQKLRGGKVVKYVVVLGDGMADHPYDELGGKTPLQYAHTPHMDLLARRGRLGLVQTIPPGMPPGSDVANLAVLGYDPRRYYTGRAPLEAASLGIDLDRDDVAFRCNLVTLSDDEPYHTKRMLDYSAGEITTAEARKLIEEVDREMGRPHLRFHPGLSYRHVLVWRNGPLGASLTPPHDISGRVIGPYLPQGDGAGEVLALMERSYPLLVRHPVNQARRAEGLNPATSIWIWGAGKKPALPPFKDLYGLEGVVIAAVDLVRGIGRCAGLHVPTVPGATGNIHTNYRGKALAALDALAAGCDFVYVHIEAPDEAGHQGSLELKVRAIEEMDSQVLGELLRGLAVYPAYRLMVLPDHTTPVSTRTHGTDPVPFVIAASDDALEEGAPAFDEAAAARSGLMIEAGYELLPRYLLG